MRNPHHHDRPAPGGPVSASSSEESTSQMCAECGYTDKNNRVSQGSFTCRSCGHAQHADRNASRIAQRGNAVWNAGRESRVPVGA
ncbi:zinc ribbon domain-containing protein [Saccharopolyspora hattusasensis]|uniref:zinc ribbon domain-containing protein n=1 Tax=Saccharopolyspora hattusasensis TaxID=1128679 RepID=UPI003D9605BF